MTRRERLKVQHRLRPSIIVRTERPCLIPLRTELWWTMGASGREWCVASVEHGEAGSDVTLILQTDDLDTSPVPALGARVCFSQFNRNPGYDLYLPHDVPWTHRQAIQPDSTDLERTNVGGIPE
jgi:hypothetical protein